MRNTLFFILIVFTFFSANSQPLTLEYKLSDAIDIPLAGWNKVLQCSNGNTLLFHFEPRKGIIVKIFDSLHKEIISKKHVCNLLDINILDRTHLDWITEINGEAVIFATQQVENRETLLKLRINTLTGSLIEESKVIQSASFKNSTTAYMLNIPETDEYYIVCNTNADNKDHVDIKRYNKLHQIVADIPVNIPVDKYDYLALMARYCNSNGGVLVGICGGKKNDYNKFDNELLFYYFVKGDTNSIQAKLKIPSGFQFISSGITYNPFDKRMNFIIYNNTEKENQDKKTLHFKNYFLITFAEDLTDFQSVPLENKLVNDVLHQQLDTNQIFVGDLNGLYTNDRGQTSLFYNGYTYDQKTVGLIGRKIPLPNLSITQITDKGKEIWGTSLAYSHLNMERTYPATFGMVSEYGILHQNFVRYKDSYYIFFNETKSGFQHIKMSEAVDSIYNADFSDGCVYKIDKKRQISKSYLFGEAKDNEHIQLIASGTSLLQNVYAALIRERKGKEVSSKIAWIHLEP